MCAERLWTSHYDIPEERPMAAAPAQPEDQPAATAGEEDHSDPWALAGEDADPPGNVS
jgi:hypothetical protein